MTLLTCTTKENKQYFFSKVNNFRKKYCFLSSVVHVLKIIEITYWKFKKNSIKFNLKHSFPGIFQIHKKFKYHSSNSKNPRMRSYWIDKLICSLNSTFDFFFKEFLKISPGVNAISRSFQKFYRGSFFSKIFQGSPGLARRLETLI